MTNQSKQDSAEPILDSPEPVTPVVNSLIIGGLQLHSPSCSMYELISHAKEILSDKVFLDFLLAENKRVKMLSAGAYN